MTGLGDEEPEGATPLTPEDREGLIPAGVTLRHELNEYEQENIAEARLWAVDRKRRTSHLQDRFGSEYDRTVESTDDRREAERELREREQRHVG